MTNSRDAQAPGAGSYASVNGLNMYHEIHGVGQPLVLLHGAFSAIASHGTGALVVGRVRALDNATELHSVTVTSARGRRCPGCWSPKVLPREQPLEAQLSGAIAQNSVET